ncbi:MAG: hypothetical protein ACI9BW_002718 [Gammaproteobacteria bacterium]|jgi:hypothetical protein
MNWSAIGTIAEIVGAIGVIVSLIYLAMQIKQGRADVQSSNFHQISNSFNDLNRQVAGDPALVRIMNIGFENYESLDEVDKTQFGMLLLTSLRVYDALYYQVQRGTGDLDLWEGELRTLKRFCSMPGPRVWWKENKFQLSAIFMLFFDGLMNENIT